MVSVKFRIHCKMFNLLPCYTTDVRAGLNIWTDDLLDASLFYLLLNQILNQILPFYSEIDNQSIWLRSKFCHTILYVIPSEASRRKDASFYFSSLVITLILDFIHSKCFSSSCRLGSFSTIVCSFRIPISLTVYFAFLKSSLTQGKLLKPIASSSFFSFPKMRQN